jgi:hypothetical protein
MRRLQYALALLLLITLSGCASERHFARDSLWPFGNPNAPDNTSETASRALGRSPDVTPIAPQAGNVWPGAVQPVPTIADIERNMNQPLGQEYIPSLPSPYPPGQAPPPDADDDLNETAPAGVATPITPMTPIAPIPPSAAPSFDTLPPGNIPPPGTAAPGEIPPVAPGNPHVRE